MATHSGVLAWRIPGTGEPGGLPSMGLHRIGHDWSDLAAALNLTLFFKSMWQLAFNCLTLTYACPLDFSYSLRISLFICIVTQKIKHQDSIAPINWWTDLERKHRQEREFFLLFKMRIKYKPGYKPSRQLLPEIKLNMWPFWTKFPWMFSVIM